jgi:hypothetical protein
MKKVVEYENSICALSTYTNTDFKILDEKFRAIEENFYNIEFYCQQFDNNKLIGGYIYKLPASILDKAVVVLDDAIDEFYIELSAPVTVREKNGFKVQGTTLNIEVVTEGIAEDNDSDFIGHGKIKELENKGEYKLGETNSYYKVLGRVGNNTYYYREL